MDYSKLNLGEQSYGLDFLSDYLKQFGIDGLQKGLGWEKPYKIPETTGVQPSSQQAFIPNGITNAGGFAGTQSYNDAVSQSISTPQSAVTSPSQQAFTPNNITTAAGFAGGPVDPNAAIIDEMVRKGLWRV